jgi:putative Holliday junction resolvase
LIRGRLIGIDHGLVRIGLAVSDATGLLARELMIVRRSSKLKDFARINAVAAEQRAIGFVVGLPLHPEATESTQTHTQKVLNWVETFRTSTSLPIVLWDEQMSSHDAAELARLGRRTARDPIDDLAARVILQSYLDALRDRTTAVPDFFRE